MLLGDLAVLAIRMDHAFSCWPTGDGTVSRNHKAKIRKILEIDAATAAQVEDWMRSDGTILDELRPVAFARRAKQALHSLRTAGPLHPEPTS
jgi:hypothetical protein